MRFIKFIGILTLIFFAGLQSRLSAQNISASQGQGNFIQFSTYSELMAGAQSIGNVQVAMSPSATQVRNWKLTVQVSAPISGNGTTLNAQYIALRFNQQLASNQTIANAIQAPLVPIPLNLAEVTLINSSAYPLQAPPDYFFTLRYDIIIQGGQHLVNLNNGGYNVPLIFRLYDGNGALRSTSTTVYNFNRYFWGEVPQNASSIEVQANAKNVVLNFTTMQNYQNGVSAMLTNGLNVSAASGYQVKVKSSSVNFTGTTQSTLPVAAVRLESSAGNNASGNIQYSTVNLSQSEQTLINKPTASSGVVYYNLRYFTAANDTRFINAQPGSYEVTLTYTLQPL